ncbi:MAG: dihydrodipicolinate synthase family protein [Verrucomicrobiota bacterium]|jgi:N-acetylneuraminate lyase|nr:dihydrodipicolinate synthase family protein [Verrucomicrobiota bacterium]
MNMKLKGLTAAVHTPMHADFSVNESRVADQAEHLARAGASGVFVTGTTGECHSLTTDERLKLFEAWGRVAHSNGLKFIAHVGHNNLPDARALVCAAAANGADAISAMAPTFFKPADAVALCDWFVQMLAGAPELPFYFYDIPAMTGVTINTREFVQRAAEHIPGLVGVKYTNPDREQLRAMLNTNGRAPDMLFGCDEELLEGLKIGCRGAVGSSYNFASPLYRKIIAAFDEGVTESAQRDQDRSAEMVRTIAKYGYNAAAKAVMGMVGIDCGPARPPLRGLSPENINDLKRDLESIGFFDWALG